MQNFNHRHDQPLLSGVQIHRLRDLCIAKVIGHHNLISSFTFSWWLLTSVQQFFVVLGDCIRLYNFNILVSVFGVKPFKSSGCWNDSKKFQVIGLFSLINFQVWKLWQHVELQMFYEKLMCSFFLWNKEQYEGAERKFFLYRRSVVAVSSVTLLHTCRFIFRGYFFPPNWKLMFF